MHGAMNNGFNAARLAAQLVFTMQLAIPLRWVRPNNRAENRSRTDHGRVVGIRVRAVECRPADRHGEICSESDLPRLATTSRLRLTSCSSI